MKIYNERIMTAGEKILIYLATNLTNGKRYVGYTKMSLKWRKKRHEMRAFLKRNGIYANNYPFAFAIRKYGIDGFNWAVVKENIPIEEFDKWERWAVLTFETHISTGKGYNATYGGEDNPMNNMDARAKISKANKGKSPWMKGRHHTEETKKQLSAVIKDYFANNGHPRFGQHHTEESKHKLSIALKGKMAGEKNPFYGRHHTEESKRKTGKANHDKYMGGGNPFYGHTHTEETKAKMRKPRVMTKKRKKLSIVEIKEIKYKYSTNNYSYSILAKEYNVSKTAIMNVIKERTKHSKIGI